MASHGRPSSALATSLYITVEPRCILARNPPVDSPSTLSPHIPITIILGPTPARNAADVGLSRLCTVGSAVLLRRSLVPTGWTRVRFSFNLEVRFSTITELPQNNHKNYKYDIRNGLSTTLPLAALC